jgi:hypothetical protein
MNCLIMRGNSILKSQSELGIIGKIHMKSFDCCDDVSFSGHTMRGIVLVTFMTYCSYRNRAHCNSDERICSLSLCYMFHCSMGTG